ncbi:ATP-binding protein [Streptomyces lydicus]|uniref:ATP-binding protein n=1 Tax=Streptomyces lydicus TaxID=47763 RepID=UPI0036EBA7CC
MLSTLAVAAGIAIENARLYEETRYRRQWLVANGDIVAGLLSGADEHGVLETIVGHAVRIRSLQMEGLLDTEVPGALADDVVAVLGEALSNVARHARADAADVALRVRDRRLTLTVEDDGVGIGAGGRRSGLRNLAERARRAGGGMSVEAPAEGGTRLAWWAPLRG